MSAFPSSDIAAGITAYSAILEAILGRGQTGKGRSIEVSLFHSIADWMNVPYLQTRYGNRPPTRMGLRHPSIAPYGAYRCGDAKALLLAVQNEREWVKLCSDVLDDVALANDQRFSSNISRVKNASALDAIIAARFAALTRDQAIAILDGAGIAYGRLSDMDDLVNHPQRRLIKVATAAGRSKCWRPASWPAPTASELCRHWASITTGSGGNSARDGRGRECQQLRKIPR